MGGGSVLLIVFCFGRLIRVAHRFIWGGDGGSLLLIVACFESGIRIAHRLFSFGRGIRVAHHFFWGGGDLCCSLLLVLRVVFVLLIVFFVLGGGSVLLIVFFSFVRGIRVTNCFLFWEEDPCFSSLFALRGGSVFHYNCH